MEGHKHSQSPKVGVVIVPFPAQGHLNQLLHLSHLISSYGLPIHYAGSATHNRQAKHRLHGWDPQSSSTIHFHDFQLPPHSSPPPNPNPTIHFPTHLQPLFDASTHLRQPVSQLLRQLSSKFERIVVIHDTLMTSVVQDTKYIPNAESYAFVPTSAFTTFFNSWDKMCHKPFPLDEDIPKFIPSTDGCYTDEILSFIANQRKFIGFESGRLYNTNSVIEDRFVQLLKRLKPDTEHFAIGPLNPVKLDSGNGNGKGRDRSLEWLDKQEADSVIYICFGSTTSMTDEQIMELAVGLERSEQKFIWVLRRADTSDVFTVGEAGKPQLPDGFEERLRNRGMVVREWTPQLEILAHRSTGGFMSHCGWNSCMESISMGVPMAAWPMHTDQPRNAVLVTDVLRVGVRVSGSTECGELVKSSAIENVLRTLMASQEGAEMQKRAAELGEAVRASVSKGVASHLERECFISRITR
ncbi:unnamed protein product [Amaranthus hypochondriacus]